MDQEMWESLSLMQMVMYCKIACPEYFHFLKGNHENILNEEGAGNHPFGKFTYEGEIVKEYIQIFYGEEFLYTYSGFEKSLPLLAIGDRFLASHAEPFDVYLEEEIINMRIHPEVIYGLTWTDNDGANEGSVEGMLKHYLPSVKEAVYFGGHRVVTDLYQVRAKGKYIQFHNPDRWTVAKVMPETPFDPEKDFVEISPNKGGVCG
jgi:hypothetical protein